MNVKDASRFVWPNQINAGNSPQPATGSVRFCLCHLGHWRREQNIASTHWIVSVHWPIISFQTTMRHRATHKQFRHFACNRPYPRPYLLKGTSAGWLVVQLGGQSNHTIQRCDIMLIGRSFAVGNKPSFHSFLRDKRSWISLNSLNRLETKCVASTFPATVLILREKENRLNFFTFPLFSSLPSFALTPRI
mgnify:CR=1 FL=1